MGQNSKIGLIILIVFCVIFAATSAGLFVLHQSEYAKSLVLESKIKDLESQKAQTQEELDKVKNDKNNIELELVEIKSKAKELEAKIEYEKRQKEMAQSNLDTKKSELVSLKSELKSNKESLSDLKEKHAQMQIENRDILDKLNQIRLVKKALEAKMGAAGISLGKGEVELGTVVVKPGIIETDGKILVVNREFNFVVIDLGEADGVEVGDYFGVYRDDKMLAKVEVEKIYEDMSSALILLQDQMAEILEDDQIKKL